MTKDTCVLCGVETQYDFETHIDLRYGYVEGVGQVCKNCFDKPTLKLQEDYQVPKNLKQDLKIGGVHIPFQIIYDTPNDQELGGKIREVYNKQINS
jgi:hypothetical protein